MRRRGRVPAAAALHRYATTGSVGDAEDVVQDAFPGLTRARRAGTTITDPKAYLTTVVSRLGINYLRWARVRRETYVGDWLPEPVVVPAGGAPKIPPGCAPSGDARPRRRFVASLPEPAPPRSGPVVTGPGHGGLPRRSQ
jgi:DNA-directed RNA polymerase specialized sigma24 family protein